MEHEINLMEDERQASEDREQDYQESLTRE